MRLVVLGEQDLGRRVELLLNLLARPELLAKPERHRFQEGRQALWGVIEVGLEEPLELSQRLVVEHHQIQISRRNRPLGQAIRDRVAWKPVIVLLPREALFLRSRDDVAVANETRRRS